MPSDAAGETAPGLVSFAAAEGDEAFEARLAETGTLAFRVAFAVLRRREDAEDVAQEALVRAYRRRGDLRDPARWRAWLVRIAWRLALDHRRAASRRGLREQAATAAAPSAEAAAVADDFRRRLWAAIDALPEKLRLVIVMSGIEGYDVKEVAGALDLPEGTVKSRLHLARKRLAAALR